MSLRLIKALFRPAKPKITSEQKQASLIRAVERKEKKIITGMPIEDGYHTYNRPLGDIPVIVWKFYYAHKYFQNKMIDANMVSRLRKGASLLSVGTGPGHLERTLLAFSVPANNIDVADVKLHEHLENTTFTKYNFDAGNDWPTLRKKYDYIVFPESIQYAMDTKLSPIKGIQKMTKIIKSAYDNLNNNGEIRISLWVPKDTLDFWIKFWNMTKANVNSILPNLKWEIEPNLKTIIIRKPN